MRINHKTKNFWLPFVLAAGFCLGWPLPATAIITGPCANCHTMHNSQGGASQALTAAKWIAGILTGTPSSTPLKNLLVTDCVGCHSSSGVATIITVNGSKIPIVYNTGGPTAGTELAGGNFYWTTVDGLNPGENKNNRGHNVAGIAGMDTLPGAPGFTGCGNSCHQSLVAPVAEASIPSSGHDQTGCEGCHLKVGHHKEAELFGTEAGNAYRFLSGHGDGLAAIVDNSLGMNEGTQWGLEGSANSNDWNLYEAQTTSFVVGDILTIGRWCAGCHGKFHAFGVEDEMFLTNNGGDRDMDPTTNPWLRHPTNVFIPGAGTEFASVIGTPYAPYTSGGIPLARNTNNITDAINTGDQVMCLSCHKAHGSQWPDALRFDYTTMDAHTGTGTRTDGCFFCHRLKDDP
jgi:predicted CXXCH cytochrome family protein